MEEAPPKTAKQLEKEAKKLAKLEKFKQKQDQKQNTSKDEKKEKKKDLIKKEKELILYMKNTDPGMKKDIDCPMPDSYSPRYVEAAWYSWWEKEGFFKPEYGRKNLSEEDPKGKFIMIIPPPNVTGSLHLGHALTNAVQDALIRWNRMKGKITLWNPGCDHAGIATQVVVEKQLWRTEKKTRHDLGREKFIEKIWEWKKEKGDRIYTQLKLLGSSFDWDRACFTMDPKLCRSVTEAFIRLHEDGDIYRCNRLVNWSCALKSAISDIEVDKIELPGRTFLSIPGYLDKVEFGVLVSFAYKIVGEDETIVVATTRIETMLGDTAIAIHPSDSRYFHLHGKFVQHPFSDRQLPIICDNFVDSEFGTGAVKITPAHDPNDYEVGKRLNLPFITIFNDEGLIIGDCTQFNGMKRFEARKAVLEALKQKNLYRETIDNPMVVPMCSRSKDIVEPLIKPQWYIRCDQMAKHASDVVKSGELKIIPTQHNKTWFYWMDNIRDWCISRQLWWGHRIPAYFITIINEQQKLKDENEYWISAHNEEEALNKAIKKFNVPKENITLKQDEDVLDTWFSSGLFPFSIFGWPDKTKDLEVFFPGTLLETGYDILFFWVARMVFLSQRLLKCLPFKTIFLHSIVRDAHGRKMSKSLGNVVDPIDVIMGISLDDLNKQLLNSNLDPKEIDKAKAGQKQDYPNGIPECGTDALRFALCSYMSHGHDINLNILRVQGYRFFCNKLWNAIKFALMYFKEGFKPTPLSKDEQLNSMDIWILSRLSLAVELCNTAFENYELSNATTACYNFWLYDLCDIYLECLKPVFASNDQDKIKVVQNVLFKCLDTGLVLLSPFMPFITEELYQRLPYSENMKYPSITIAQYPEIENYQWRNLSAEAEVEFIQLIVHSIRSALSDYNVPKSSKTETYIKCNNENSLVIVNKYKSVIASFANCSKVETNVTNIPTGCAILSISNKCQVHILLKGLIEISKEIEKLKKKSDQLHQTIEKLIKAMNVVDYETKVPEDVIKSNQEKLKQSKDEIDRLTEAIEVLKLMDL
ncbi:valine--tRNA ligase [Daktulosphaira vitifoliae]|uniref:valine--tRNA ligase n=1 Tax=Daktulosphaira vitifoliae TaxID=58002 RepID=UPI0021AAFD73|nr:valine--tRNA ligase [Daktulosphaira vitifoliae]